MKFTKWKTLSTTLLMAISMPVLAASVSTTASDTLITTKIKSELAGNAATHASTISVETNNGVVTLSGTAGTNDEASTAVQIAESVKNVKDVDASKLVINGATQPLTDTYITAKVKGMFIKNDLVGPGKDVPITTISVDTQQGVVTLSGTVKHHWQIAKAVKLAKSVNGVTQVVSQLKVD